MSEPAAPHHDPMDASAATAPAEAHGHATADNRARQVVVVTGISGSGKSVALHALEDAGFFCVDNLPPELLPQFMALEQARIHRRLAVAVDARTASSLPTLLPLIDKLRAEGVQVRSIFLDASTDALVRRFSETRRPHPLSQGAHLRYAQDGPRPALIEAIELERELLAELRAVSTVLDTSQLRPAQLRLWLSDLVKVEASRLTLVFESFAFKYGVPLDADLVFDVRVLPNPYYEPSLRPLNGRDEPVRDYLAPQADVQDMLDQIDAFITRWLPKFGADQRSYLTVAIGCTGGQHRSVYMVETLARRFRQRTVCLVRHRELDER